MRPSAQAYQNMMPVSGNDESMVTIWEGIQEKGDSRNAFASDHYEPWPYYYIIHLSGHGCIRTRQNNR